MKKVLNLDLDYELDDQRKDADPAKVPDNPRITRNIIENAYAINHPSMGSKTSRLWRSLVKRMEELLEQKKVFLILSDGDFDSIHDEVYNCEFPHQQAFIVPVLLDELDRVKSRSLKDAKELLETIEQSEKASDQVSKVLEMSKGKKS